MTGWVRAGFAVALASLLAYAFYMLKPMLSAVR